MLSIKMFAWFSYYVNALFDKYSPPLKIHFLVKFVLFVSACFTLTPMFLLFPGRSSIRINGLQYNVPDYPWLIWVGAICLTLIGIAAIMVLKNINYSMSYLAVATLIAIASNGAHPDFKITFRWLIFMMLVPGLLLWYEYIRARKYSNNIKP
jgi:hypothetical protein